MSSGQQWKRDELLVAFSLYCQLPFGKLHSKNPEIIKNSQMIGRTPSALSMKLCNIASLDNAIIATGRKGLSGVSQADRDMWEEMRGNWEQFVFNVETALKNFSVQPEQTAAPNNYAEDYTGNERIVQSAVRVGQSFFRNALLSAYEKKCCITGLSDQRLLVASHIVPWRCDRKNRLNPRNGLLLSVLHDKAFDLGIITVNEDMTLRVSNYLSTNDSYLAASILAYDGKSLTMPRKFQPDPSFLSYHRIHIFDKERRET
ncbi:MAG: HNH endonuclease [Candidatus Electronema sp. V4]|uniref:HNH endonuclease n=1 Tax=Candidatus Electronema sp. V4 TaxID=3454756 RepID=UPI0040558DBE